MSNQIMCHVVAGYPTYDDCLQLMKRMDKAGVCAIEVQIPFSDPIADGETIMYANDVAVEAGISIRQSFELIREARQHRVSCDIKVMSYFQKVNRLGLKKFCQEAKSAGVSGLIIPDLPYDTPEYSELASYANAQGIEIIPVVSPGMSQNRLSDILGSVPKAIYVTSQRGITGNSFEDNEQLNSLIKQIRSEPSDPQIMVGFGISNLSDVRQALQIADLAVVGSAVIRQVQFSGIDGAADFIKNLVTGKAVNA